MCATKWGATLNANGRDFLEGERQRERERESARNTVQLVMFSVLSLLSIFVPCQTLVDQEQRRVVIYFNKNLGYFFK